MEPPGRDKEKMTGRRPLHAGGASHANHLRPALLVLLEDANSHIRKDSI